MGWQYSAVIFIGINMVAFLCILVGYICIYFSVTSSRKAAGNISNDDIVLARKLTFIVLTDFVCWTPIILMSIASLFGVRIPAHVSAWVAIIVLPINSAINPILYTIANINCGSSRNKKQNKTSASSSSGITKVPP